MNMTDRKKIKNIQILRKEIPEEFKSAVDQIVNFYYQKGVTDTYSLLESVIKIPPLEIAEYCVVHFDELEENE